MLIWVVGSSGMLGQTVVNLLKEKSIPFIATNKNEANICDVQALENIIKNSPKITHIINCAAYTAVDLAEKNLKEAFAINVNGSMNLSFLAKKYSLKLILISSDYVFSGDKEIPYLEDDMPSPINAYGTTKWLAEEEAKKINPNICIVRTSWLFGPYGKNFVQTMIKLMQERDTISIVNDQWGRPTYTKDLALVLLDLLTCEGIFHFASFEKTSWFDFAQKILEVGKKININIKTKKFIPIKTENYPTLAKRPLYSVLDTHKIDHVLPKRAKRKIEEVLEEYLEESIWELSAK